MRKVIETKNAPAAVGPYSQALEVNNLVYISGQLPIDPESGEIKEGIEEQTVQCFKNLQAICEAAETNLDNAVQVTLLTTKLQEFELINNIYADYMNEPYPARIVSEASNLPKGVLIEIAAIIQK